MVEESYNPVCKTHEKPVKKVRNYCKHGEVVVEWFECGCSAVTYVPIGNTDWFLKSESKKRYAQVRDYIERVRGYYGFFY